MMRTVAAVALLWFCSTVSGDDATEATVTAAAGDIARLPCSTADNVTPSVTTWAKDGRDVARGDSPTPSTAGQRVSVLQDGSLNIRELTPADAGAYLCTATLLGSVTWRSRVLLQVASGPENLTMSISPTNVLPNGTLFAYRSWTVTFNCSGSSHPSQQLTWAFRGASTTNDSLVSTSDSWLVFRRENIQPGAQGVYSCVASNRLSGQAVNKSTELLVYYFPERHPECMWAPAQDPSHFHFICTWFGAYPSPTLRWVEDQGGDGVDGKETVYASDVSESLTVTMNRSLLTSGQTLRCQALHLMIPPEKQMSCSFNLKAPYPEGELMVTALEGTSTTLTCTEATSAPPANTTWRKGLEQEEITPGSKYAISEEGPVLRLTIRNVSKDDEGVYFCRSENPLAVRELEVYVTVKPSSSYTGAIIGVFIAALVVGSAAIAAKTVYSSRHRVCLGGVLGQTDDDRGDVLSLVDSDDEQFFPDVVPRLPPLTEERPTTLVQIHRIPSTGGQEEAEAAGASVQQQEDTLETDEPPALVTL